MLVMQENPIRFSRENVIVSVDDFGIRDVAESILPLAKQGKVVRVSVLINYEKSAAQAKELAATGVKIDLHLELIDLIKSGKEDNGMALFRGLNFAARYAFGMVSVSDVERAWVQQIELFKKMFGRYPDGLNSHEHVHYFPRFFRIVLMLGDRYGIPFIRFASEGILEKRSSIAARVISLLWWRNTAYYKENSESRETPDFFVSYDWIDDFSAFLRNLPAGKTEIVFHPERKGEYDSIEACF